MLWFNLLLVTLVTAAQVDTDCGPVAAGGQNSGINYFLGIKYGATPVGDMRWQPSVSLHSANQCWSGALNASQFGSICYQGGGGSEDCLFLNVWVPITATPQSRLPTYFYIHGGGFNEGSGDLDGTTFVQDSGMAVVMVSINYRLNGFGFMSLRELTANSTTNASGNYGVTDMINALQWVQRNIANFGGDPNSVTIFGQSSGGTGVLMCILSPLASGLFHKAILMSSSTLIEYSLEQADAQNRIFVNTAGCGNATDVVQCLKNLTASQLYNSLPWNVFPYWSHMDDFSIPVPSHGDMAMLGIVDGYVIPYPVTDALSSGKANDVPVIFGSMAQEVDLFPGAFLTGYNESQYTQFITNAFAPFNDSTLIEGILSLYPMDNYNNTAQLAYDTLTSDIKTTCGQNHLADLASTSFQSPVYRYVVTQSPSNRFCWGSSGYCPQYAFHTWDLDALLDSYPSNFTMEDPDKAYATELRAIWYSFGKYGVVPASLQWDPVVRENGAFLDIRIPAVAGAVGHYHEVECAFWEKNNFYQYSWNS